MIEFKICTCGGFMRVSTLDIGASRVDYQCVLCGNIRSLSVEEAEAQATRHSEYFILNADGTVSWKCYTHGCCDGFIGVGKSLDAKMLNWLYAYECPYCEIDIENGGDVSCQTCGRFAWEEDESTYTYDVTGGSYCSSLCLLQAIVKALAGGGDEFRLLQDAQNLIDSLDEDERKNCLAWAFKSKKAHRVALLF